MDLLKSDVMTVFVRRRAQDAPHSLGDALANQFSWSVLAFCAHPLKILMEPTRNYDHLSSLWQHEEWLPEAAVELARAHYSAYMVKRVDGLRIIALNTDLCECLWSYLYFIVSVLFLNFPHVRVQVRLVLTFYMAQDTYVH